MLFAGDNGMGKSTLMEAIAQLAGCNPDGGSRYMRFAGLDDASPLHRLLHGESVWAMVSHRFADGLYLLDEPESGLSPMRQMALLAQIDELARGGAQFIIATHSPILLAIPGATIFELTDDGIRVAEWRDCGAVADMREFFGAPEETVRFLTSPDGDHGDLGD